MDHELIKSMISKWGNTFYICSLPKFRSNLDKFHQEFCKHYPKTRLGYSYKTNYLPELCKIVDKAGYYAEVVSEFEYGMARYFGVDPERILLNGPAKSGGIISTALDGGSLINLDSCREVELACDHARSHPAREFKVGLRLNLSAEHDHSSRFGIDPEMQEFEEVLKTLKEVPNLHLSGLHSHANTAGRTVESYVRRLSSMIAVARSHALLDRLEYLDLGGGFFGEVDADLAERFSYPIPTFEEYAKGITEVLKTQLSPGHEPAFILEPGVAVVANCWSFVCQVESVKTIAGKSHAFVTGGLQNVRPNLDPFDLPFTRIAGDGAREATPPVCISGYTCMEKDILCRAYDQPLREGDYLVICNTGAYSLVFKPPFIRGAPPIAVIEDSGQASLARREETVEDLLVCYRS